MSTIQLYNGDCLELITEIPSNSIDLIITDPPYKTIKGGNKSAKWVSRYGGSILSKNDGKIFNFNNVNNEKWIKEAYRVLKNGSHFYIMTNLINLFEFKKLAEKAGFKLHNLLVWEKNTCTANRWYMKNCEYILFFRKGKAKSINNASTKTVHQFDNIVGKKLHPTEKPVELMKLYIENSSEIGEIVLDPFMGSGSTGIACVSADRSFIGYELDEGYFKIAKERIENVKKETKEHK